MRKFLLGLVLYTALSLLLIGAGVVAYSWLYWTIFGVVALIDLNAGIK